MAAASVTSQLAITASPLSAAVVYYLTELGAINSSITLAHILGVTVPATLLATFIIALYSMRRGVELEQDSEYLRRLNDPIWKEKILSTTTTSLDEQLPYSARNSVLLFLLALLFVVVLAMLPSIRTIAPNSSPVAMSIIIQMMMLAFGGLILLSCKVPAARVADGVVFKSGLTAAIAIFGIAWMSDTYFQYAMPTFKSGIIEMVHSYPWTFALAMFLVSVVVNSQAATCRMMLPVALGMGLPPQLLVGIMPSCYGYFFIPNYPSDIATCNFDTTGTTKIGKYYFNHSFMIPGLLGTGSACIFGYGLAGVVF